MYLFQRVQRDSFLDELTLLKQGRTVAKGSKLYQLTCSLDNDDIIHLNGRLSKARHQLFYRQNIKLQNLLSNIIMKM